jgi:hypothetical protein
MKRHKLKIGIGLLCLAAYLIAFIEVHRSATLRRPAANLLYWYYSDNPLIERSAFYGFWPLRQIAYHVPGFTARHNLERIQPSLKDSDL